MLVIAKKGSKVTRWSSDTQIILSVKLYEISGRTVKRDYSSAHAHTTLTYIYAYNTTHTHTSIFIWAQMNTSPLATNIFTKR